MYRQSTNIVSKLKVLFVVSFVIFIGVGAAAFSSAYAYAAAAAVAAVPTDSAIIVNGSEVAFNAYRINDYNYFKLRDLAYTLSGTEKQFEVGWDEANNTISLTSGMPYTVAGGGNAGAAPAAAQGAKEAVATYSKIYINGRETNFIAYTIDGYNYFMLRDIGAAFDFGVDWDEARDMIIISTSKGYTPAGPGAGIAPTGTEGMSQAEYLEVYGEVLATWKSDLKRHINDEQIFGMTFEFWFYNGYTDKVKTYYALYDIDGNGVKELLLKKQNDSYEDIIAYIFTIYNGKPINLFGYDDISGAPREVPWSRVGSCGILKSGLIDCYYADYAVYKINGAGDSVVEFASSEPYDYPDEASKAEAEWRYYISGVEVDYDYYTQYLNENGYSIDDINSPADIEWILIELLL